MKKGVGGNGVMTERQEGKEETADGHPANYYCFYYFDGEILQIISI